jgi:hypothetical protein
MQLVFSVEKQNNLMKTHIHTSSSGYPVGTVLLFGAAIAGLVIFGSHISKQRSMARDAGIEAVMPILGH